MINPNAAIRAGIFNDLGSGSNVDLCVLTKDGIEWLRNYEQPNPRTYVRSKPYVFDRGTAQVLVCIEAHNRLQQSTLSYIRAQTRDHSIKQPQICMINAPWLTES